MEEAPFIGPKNKWQQEDPEKQNEDCLFCGHPLERETFRDSVRNHCNIKGECHGAAHHSCNMNYFRINPDTVFMPVIFHNLKNYDEQAIAEMEGKLECIPQSIEK